MPRPNAFAALTLAVLGLLGPVAGCTKPAPPALGVVIAPVRVAPVVRRPVALQIPTVGTVVPVEVSRVAAGVAGMVVSYPLREGTLVQEGETLASLRTASLEIQIEEARANLLEKQQVLAELEAGLRPEEIAQAKARMQAAEAEFKYAEAHSKRVEDLASRADRTVTDRELDEARYDTERTRQAFAQAQADYDLKLSGYREEQIAAARAAADAQQKVIDNLQDELERMTIKAPFTGYLVEKHTEVGEWLQMGGIVATLARLDEVEVQLNVEESMIYEIRIEQVVDVHVNAIAGRTLPGTVRQIIPRSQWTTGSRSFPVIVRMKNVIQDGRPLLSEGMVARVVFTGEQREALLADKDAVLRSTNKPLVYVAQLKSDGKLATVRPVEVSEGLSEGQYVEVSGELQEGDLVVVEGVEGLRPFDEVEVIDSGPKISTDRTRDPQSGLLSAD